MSTRTAPISGSSPRPKRTARPQPAAAALPLVVIRIVPQAPGTAAVLALIEQARLGLHTSQLRATGARLELPLRELAPLLATTERTLARRLDQPGELNKTESERLLLLQRLADHGTDVFEDQGKFNRWLRRPLPLLGGQSPLELLDTASGFQVVDELLGRIEYGVYS